MIADDEFMILVSPERQHDGRHVPTRSAPRNESEFVELMEQIDAEFAAAGVPVHARGMRMRGEVSRLLAVEQWPMLAVGDPLDGVYEGIDLTIRVDRWIAERYGKALAVDFRPGRMAVLLRGHVWAFHFPLFIGQHEMFISRTELSEDRLPGPSVGPPPRFNVLDAVEDLPPGLRSALTDAELKYLWDAFHLGLPAYLLMRFVRKQALVREALTDHASCVNHLTGTNHHAGIARWDALQAAEKMMKAALTAIGAQVPRTHELTRLAAALFENGLEPIDPTWIDIVQCEAGVRYGDVRSTISDAITAHHASLRISRHVAVAIRSAMTEPDASWTGL